MSLNKTETTLERMRLIKSRLEAAGNPDWAVNMGIHGDPKISFAGTYTPVAEAATSASKDYGRSVAHIIANAPDDLRWAIDTILDLMGEKDGAKEAPEVIPASQMQGIYLEAERQSQQKRNEAHPLNIR